MSADPVVQARRLAEIGFWVALAFNLLSALMEIAGRAWMALVLPASFVFLLTAIRAWLADVSAVADATRQKLQAEAAVSDEMLARFKAAAGMTVEMSVERMPGDGRTKH